MIRAEEGIRSPVDASKDVQSSVEDIRGVLRALRTRQEEIDGQLTELALTQQTEVDGIRKDLDPGNFTEFKQEVIFLAKLSSLYQSLISAGTKAIPGLGFVGDEDTGIFSDVGIDFTHDAEQVAAFFRTSGVASTLRVMDDDGAEFIRIQKNDDSSGFILLDGANRDLVVGGQTAGTGVLHLRTGGTNRWTVDSSGHLVPVADDSYNVGETGAGVSHVLLATGAVGDPPIADEANQDLGIFFDATAARYAKDGVDMGEILGGRPSALVHRTSDVSIALNTASIITFQAALYDNMSWWDSSTKIVPDIAGTYLVIGGGKIASVSAAQRVRHRIMLNGAITKGNIEMGAASGQAASLGGDAVAIVDLNGTTDYLELEVYQSTGAARNWLADYSSLWCIYIGDLF